jgi:hypothetical protein
MKRLLSVLVLLLAAGAAFANTFNEIPFLPMSPGMLGRGGSEIANARGWDALFGNPAGFSRDPSAFTLSSTTSWVYARPDQFLGLLGQFAGGSTTPSSLVTFMSDQVTRGGIGAGASWGIGYVGGGLGLGAAVILDSILSGPSLLGVTGDLTGTIGFVVGLSVPFDVAGFKVHVGGDVRPMVRVHAPLDNATAVSMLNALANGGDVFASLGTAQTFYGVGIGLDAGAIAELGWFNLGISIRDLAGTQFRYNYATFSAVQSAVTSSLQFPTTGTLESADQYVIPMDIGVGLDFHPDFGTFNNVLDPSITLEMRNVVGALAGEVSPWTLLHVGAEMRVFSIFSIRGGLNQGYLTAGGGLKFAFLDLNFAVFTRELGLHVGDQPLAGMTMDASIRW